MRVTRRAEAPRARCASRVAVRACLAATRGASMVTGFGTPVHHQQSKSLFRFPPLSASHVICPPFARCFIPRPVATSRGSRPCATRHRGPLVSARRCVAGTFYPCRPSGFEYALARRCLRRVRMYLATRTGGLPSRRAPPAAERDRCHVVVVHKRRSGHYIRSYPGHQAVLWLGQGGRGAYSSGGFCRQ